VESTRPNGGDCCHFVFHGGLGDSEIVTPQRETVMPWRYHLGHLYWTLSGVLLAELGQTGEVALHEALKAFSASYGEEALATILAFRDLDFALPLFPGDV
jgi:hypothetical protein